MAKLTNTQLSIELSTLRVAYQQLEVTNALRLEEDKRKDAKIGELEAVIAKLNKELLRRGSVINMYAVQNKSLKAKCDRPNQTEFRARMEAAKAEAIATGKSVKV